MLSSMGARGKSEKFPHRRTHAVELAPVRRNIAGSRRRSWFVLEACIGTSSGCSVRPEQVDHAGADVGTSCVTTDAGPPVDPLSPGCVACDSLMGQASAGIMRP